jgi:hypothetical protein
MRTINADLLLCSAFGSSGELIWHRWRNRPNRMVMNGRTRLRLLWSLDLSHRKTRPLHPNSNRKAQEAFKKGASPRP